ncbi:hypothetical protein SAMN04488526_3313 [Jannaschia helgolandensis]|uniref:Pentapeptide repeat-containing protein n=2 Tax=Jannaschia helgolandensis TaxID=188906 RepID=A0A1H7SDH8_9RHOB|nr:hypothetical protein SAMN04488526_3313 [Jannaschia helgolandensis]|tara:strand:+ start:330 stop:1967 length:1638 start_codon:yes stop_codon:yes gene_type:complete
MALAGPDGFDKLPCNPAEIEGEVPKHRVLSPEFLRLILTRAHWVEALAKPQVLIQCAKLGGPLELDNVKVSPSFALIQSHMPRGATFTRANFDRDLSFIGSSFGPSSSSFTAFQYGFSAQGLSVGGDLYLGGASFRDVDINSAKVGGSLNASGSTFEGLFRAVRLSVGGTLDLTEVLSFQDVDLSGAHVGNSVIANGSNFEGSLRADNLSVGGGIGLSGVVASKDVSLHGAQVGGQVDAMGSTFEGSFIAEGLSVGRDLFLRGGSSFQRVNISRASISGALLLAGSKFDGDFDFSASSANEIVLFQPNMVSEGRYHTDDPIWSVNARLNLRNTAVVVLQSRTSSWRNKEGGWISADLSGFTYDRLAGLLGGVANTLSDETAAGLVNWLVGIRLGDDRYDPQPYEQLADVLGENGQVSKAKAIRYAKFRHRDLSQDSEFFMVALARASSRWVVGYGVYPFFAVYWYFTLVVIGFMIALFSSAELLRPLHLKFWYSLETALPLVEFSEKHKAIDHGSWLVESWFHFQKLIGFGLATFLVGALTLLAS